MPKSFTHLIVAASLFAFSALTGCQKAATTSTLSISFPKSDLSQSKVGSLANVDRSLLCYAVNITGKEIQASSRTCEIPRGIMKGSVAGGGSIDIENIPVGSVGVEIYGLMRASASTPCPTLTHDAGTWPPQKTFRLYTNPSVALVAGANELAATLVDVDSTQHIVAEGLLPAACGVTAGAAGASYVKSVVGASSNQLTVANGYKADIRVRNLGSELSTTNGYKFFPNGKGAQ